MLTLSNCKKFYRFLSSAVSTWSSIKASFRTLVKAYHLANPLSAEDDNEELKFKITGQDFVFDLLAVLDVMTSIDQVMKSLKTFALPR